MNTLVSNLISEGYSLEQAKVLDSNSSQINRTFIREFIEYSPEQINELLQGKKNGINITFYSSPEVPAYKMKWARIGLEEGIRPSLLRGYLSNETLVEEQLEQIILGLIACVDVLVYDKPHINSADMERIRESLEVYTNDALKFYKVGIIADSTDEPSRIPVLAKTRNEALSYCEEAGMELDPGVIRLEGLAVGGVYG
jgi:hypothetical protein